MELASQKNQSFNLVDSISNFIEEYQLDRSKLETI